MFLRDDIIKIKTSTRLVPYCRNCKGKHIKTIQTCEDCGSNDIANPMEVYKFDDAYDEKIGSVDKFEERKAKIYKCDLCGKEFDGLSIDNYVSFCDGDFYENNYKKYADSENTDYINYQLPNDLCMDCKNRLATHLDLKLIDFTREENINNLIKEYIKLHTNK